MQERVSTSLMGEVLREDATSVLRIMGTSEAYDNWQGVSEVYPRGRSRFCEYIGGKLVAWVSLISGNW